MKKKYSPEPYCHTCTRKVTSNTIDFNAIRKAQSLKTLTKISRKQSSIRKRFQRDQKCLEWIRERLSCIMIQLKDESALRQSFYEQSAQLSNPIFSLKTNLKKLIELRQTLKSNIELIRHEKKYQDLDMFHKFQEQGSQVYRIFLILLDKSQVSEENQYMVFKRMKENMRKLNNRSKIMWLRLGELQQYVQQLTNVSNCIYCDLILLTQQSQKVNLQIISRLLSQITSFKEQLKLISQQSINREIVKKMKDQQSQLNDNQILIGQCSSKINHLEKLRTSKTQSYKQCMKKINHLHDVNKSLLQCLSKKQNTLNIRKMERLFF